MSLTVSEVARLSGVTVRTLHHYDQIGLLRPSHRGANGYRHYDTAALDRLQRILFYRELELPLAEIHAVLDREDDPLDHLQRQHDLLLEQRQRIDDLIQTLEKTMDARKIGVNLTPEEMLEVFGDFDPAEYADEAEERWGGTDAWERSRARASRYTKEDWRRLVEDGRAFNQRLADAMLAGQPADGEVAMDLAEEARLAIHETFYDCPPERHRSLGTMYVTDPRFAATYNEVADGLAVWFRDAIHANAARHGVTEDGW